MDATQDSRRAAREPRWQRAAVLLLALGFYAVLAALLSIKVWQSPLSQYIGGGGDPQQTMWFLAWTPFALTHGHNPLFSDYLNYPTGVNMLWQTSNLTPGLLLAPATALWGPIATYNVLMTASLALAAWFAFISIRRYVPGIFAAGVGGMIYGFSPFMIAQSQGHAHMVVSGITPPLLLLLIDEVLIRQRRRTWVLAISTTLFVVAQMFTSEEVLVTEVAAAAIAATTLVIMHRDQLRLRLPYAARVIAPAAMASAVLLAFPVYQQFFGPARVTGVIHPPEAFVTDPLNFVVPTSIQLIAPDRLTAISDRFVGNISEWDGYLGLPLMALLVVVGARYWQRSALIRVTALTGGLIGLLTLGGHLHFDGRAISLPLPWWIPEHLPVLVNIQPNRFMLYVFLAAAIVAAFALSRLAQVRRQALTSVVLALVLLIPLLPRVPLDSENLSPPTTFARAAAALIPPDTAVATVPWATGDITAPMVWQVATNMRFRLIGGYVIGPIAPGQADLKATFESLARTAPPGVASAEQLATLRSELKDARVGAVVMGPVSAPQVAVEFLDHLLGVSPHISDGFYVWLTR